LLHFLKNLSIILAYLSIGNISVQNSGQVFYLFRSLLHAFILYIIEVDHPINSIIIDICVFIILAFLGSSYFNSKLTHDTVEILTSNTANVAAYDAPNPWALT
jgi:uncharacterized protein YacL